MGLASLELQNSNIKIEYKGYSASHTPDGRFLVLHPDGLTWETEHITEEDAQSYALALNEWLEDKPLPTTMRPFFNNGIPDVISGDGLFRAIDKLTNYR